VKPLSYLTLFTKDLSISGEFSILLAKHFGSNFGGPFSGPFWISQYGPLSSKDFGPMSFAYGHS
jgi:hypothetical protein